MDKFQSSFELMGYITLVVSGVAVVAGAVSKLFRAYGLYNPVVEMSYGNPIGLFQSSFELMGYITFDKLSLGLTKVGFQSSFELMGYITHPCT